MKLRAQLVLAFLGFSVLPLTVVTLYSYAASQEVLRQALETEANALAEGMGSRMEAITAELRRRMESLRGRPQRARSDAYEQARREALAQAQEAQTTEILRGVLSQTPREQGEIPFAFDARGQLLSSDPGDRARLAPLALEPDSAGLTIPRGALEDWVVVTRRDAASGTTLGIAQPVGESLREIRRTAVRNLGYGLGVVALALLGVLPLSGRMTHNLERLATGAEQLARGNLEARVAVRSRDEFGRLADTFNRMAQALGEHQKKLLERERLRKELEMCRRIQDELLPREPLPLQFGEVKGVSIPAREVGGDFFNYFVLPGGELAVLVGDVSGKGVAAALLMANLQATLLARLPLDTDLARLAERLDVEIEARTTTASYLTLFMAVVDAQGRRLRYVNAGHQTQFVLRAEGGLEPLESLGRPIGLLPGGGYEQRELELGEGDALFLFTDGLSEAENAAGEPFGDRLPELLGGLGGSPTDEILAVVERAVLDHRQGAAAADDATMVVLALRAPADGATG